jgi:flavin reductase (DIM6/NTAB) family NADH-FMN oxidoreductase RutF
MVAESPASFECRVQQVIDLDYRGERTNALVVARVTKCHVAAVAFDEQGRPDPAVLRLVGRLGGPRWCRTTDWIELSRPVV